MTIVTRPITTKYGNYDRRVSIRQGPDTLKPGQIIDAVTLTNSHQGQVSLRIGEAIIKASTNITFQQNTQLSLKVVQLRPHLLLKLISFPDASAETRALQNATLSWLPQQSRIAPVLAELIYRAMTGEKLQQQLATQALVNALIDDLPTRNTLIHAEGVRQAILQSGLFLESKLSRLSRRHGTVIKTDIKAILLRLLQVIEQDFFSDRPNTRIMNTAISYAGNSANPPRRKGLPVTQTSAPYANATEAGNMPAHGPELLCKLQGAVARLGLLQVYTAENHFNGDYIWQLEIPVKHTEAVETVSINIENEQKGPLNEDRNTWVVNLALDLPSLGPIEIRISLYRQGVTSCFWSASHSILCLIESQFTQLKSSLEEHGIEALALCCQHGNAAATKPLDTEISNLDIQV